MRTCSFDGCETEIQHYNKSGFCQKHFHKSRTRTDADREYAQNYDRERRESNKEAWLEKNRKWRANNKERIKEYNRQYYAENPEVVKAVTARWRKANPKPKSDKPKNPRAYRSARDPRESKSKGNYIQQYKVSVGCMDCGYNDHPDALEFDHRDPKEKSFAISQYWGHSWEELKMEIAKCDVVCANCHRIRTSVRRKNPRNL